MGTGYSKKKKQAKAFQEKLGKMQEELKKMEIAGSAGNGLVTVTLNGESQMLNITINPECVDPEDVEGLEDLVKAAYNDAAEKLGQQSLPGGISGMDGLAGLGGLGGLGL